MKNQLSWILLVVTLIVSLLPLSSAYLGNYPVGKCVQIKTILNTSSVNISTISYPNSSIAISNVLMIKTSRTFVYNFCYTSQLGTYIYDYFDAEGNIYVNDFSIGKPEASGGVIVFFMIAIILIVGGSCWVSLYSIGHLMNLDFDIVDLSLDWGLFFAIVVLYYLETVYLGNPAMDAWLLLVIKIGAVLLVFIPIVAFILSITIGTINKKKMNIGTPPRMFLRRKI